MFVKAFTDDDFDVKKSIYRIIKIAEITRSKGLLAIDAYINKNVENEFLIEGIRMIVDGAD